MQRVPRLSRAVSSYTRFARSRPRLVQNALGGSHLQAGADNLLMVQRAMGTDAEAAYAPEGAATKKVIAELPKSKWTTSLQISVKHEPGSLFRCVEAFNDLGINMTRINSRVPRSDSPYTLTIYVDYEGDSRDDSSRKLLERLQCCSEFVSTTASWEMPWIPRKIADLDQFASEFTKKRQSATGTRRAAVARCRSIATLLPGCLRRRHPRAAQAIFSTDHLSPTGTLLPLPLPLPLSLSVSISNRLPRFPFLPSACSAATLDAGDALESDHPGFADAEYRARRDMITTIASSYRSGTSIPTVDYTQVI